MLSLSCYYSPNTVSKYSKFVIFQPSPELLASLLAFLLKDYQTGFGRRNFKAAVGLCKHAIGFLRRLMILLYVNKCLIDGNDSDISL